MAILQPVIMAGGKGTRLWPLSRGAKPKQFLPLVGKNAMIADAAALLAKRADARPPIVVTGEEQGLAARRALSEAGLRFGTIVLEPVGRSTTAVAAIAALLTAQHSPDAIIVLLAADHIIADPNAFNRALDRAVTAAGDGYLALFGVKPSAASTQYGYIQCGPAISEGVYRVTSFKEKPDAAAAAGFLAEGHYLWNSGNFVFRADAMLKELDRHAQDILASCEKALSSARKDEAFLHLDAVAMKACRTIALDRAVMEKTDQAVVVQLDSAWADIGAWGALWQLAAKDARGNAVQGDAVLEDCEGVYVRSGHGLLAAIGLRDLVIITDADATLVVPRGRDSDVGAFVEGLRALGRKEADIALKVERPWGSYEVLQSGEGFQVKYIEVLPGQALSLQYHHKRAEHWVVVRGSPRIRVGDETRDYKINESVFVPLGAKHRLENPTKDTIAIIEVQVGSYLGEDDIVRLEDRYNRT